MKQVSKEQALQQASWQEIGDILRSPCCHQPLEPAGDHAHCGQCRVLYRLENGILNLLPPSQSQDNQE